MGQVRFVAGVLAFLSIALAGIAPGAHAADTQQINISRQFGLPYIPLVIMEQKQLIEKHPEIDPHPQALPAGTRPQTRLARGGIVSAHLPGAASPVSIA